MSKESLKTKEKTSITIKKPPMYKVIFFNDDFTPFEFVEKILTVIFNKNESEAKQIALKIHKEGKAIVSVYPKEIASTKKHLVDMNAVKHGYPLKCDIEPEEV